MKAVINFFTGLKVITFKGANKNYYNTLNTLITEVFEYDLRPR